MIQDWLWHSTIAWLGAGGITIVILAVIAWFIPGFRMLAIEIGGAILTAMSIYAKGASDAKRRQQQLQKEAEDRAIASGKSDRAAAERDVANGVDDGFDTDKR